MALRKHLEAGRACAALSCVLALLLLGPLTGHSMLTAAETAAVSLLVLALANTLACAPRGAPLLLRRVAATVVRGDPGPPLLRTRATDPAHHPLAPRAPGLG